MSGILTGHILETMKRYRTVLLVLAAGVVLMLLPSGGEEPKGNGQGTYSREAAFDLKEFEERVERVLSEIEGAGQVQVVLTVKSGSRRILAQDIKQSGQERSATTVLVGGLSAGQESVVVQTLSPEFQGALVVCPGGDDPAVRLALSRAVCALTGLGSDRVSVCKGS